MSAIPPTDPPASSMNAGSIPAAPSPRIDNSTVTMGNTPPPANVEPVLSEPALPENAKPKAEPKNKMDANLVNTTLEPKPVAPPTPEPAKEEKSKDPKMAMTTTPNTKASKFGLFISILIVVVLLIWGGVAFLFVTNNQLETELGNSGDSSTSTLSTSNP